MKTLLIALCLTTLSQTAVAAPRWSDSLIAAAHGRLNLPPDRHVAALDDLIRSLTLEIPPQDPEFDRFMAAWTRADRPWSPERRFEEYALLRAHIGLKLLSERARVTTSPAPADVLNVVPELLYQSLRTNVGAALVDEREIGLADLNAAEPVEREAYGRFTKLVRERLMNDVEDLIRTSAARETRRPFLLGTLAVALPALTTVVWLDPQPAWLAPTAIGVSVATAIVAAAWHSVVVRRRVVDGRRRVTSLIEACEADLRTEGF